MMEHESISLGNHDEELEEGELSGQEDEVYTVLERPNIQAHLSAHKSQDLDEISDTEDDCLRTNTSDSCDDSDTSNNYRSKKQKRSPRPKIRPSHAQQGHNKLKAKKYNIWSEGLQEEALTENLQGCDVTNGDKINRSVESYNFTLKYRGKKGGGDGGGEKNLKRRQSNSDDSEMNYCAKRFKNLSSNSSKRNKRKKSNGSTHSEDSKNMPRHILDLTITEECTNEEIATDIANKLCEEKDDLLLRIINTIGKTIPMALFRETQKIESEGGMMIMNNQRRRTPGGVFLFLLKHSTEISDESRKKIFAVERQASIKDKKRKNIVNRELKVEELKQKLKDKNLPKLANRGDKLEMSHLKPKIPYCMSNPPPSPVNEGRENSSDYDTHSIQHVNVTTPEKSTGSAGGETTTITANTSNNKEEGTATGSANHGVVYDDDFLDMNCDDMELF